MKRQLAGVRGAEGTEKQLRRFRRLEQKIALTAVQDELATVDVDNGVSFILRAQAGHVAPGRGSFQFGQQVPEFAGVVHRNSYGVKFTERKEFLYDPAVFKRADVVTALRLNAEYTKAHSPNNPYPTVFEVDRANARIDPVWHVSLDERTVFSRQFQMPMIIKTTKPDWRLTKVGIVPQQRSEMWFSNLHLAEVDWWPMRGDFVYWNGYRNMIVDVELRPENFWQQTNVWLCVVCRTIIPAEGDARPVTNPAVLVPREIIQTRPAPEV